MDHPNKPQQKLEAAPLPNKRPSLTSSKFEIRRSSDTHSATSPKEQISRSHSKLCYRAADIVSVMAIVFPLSIMYWRGVWNLMAFYSAFWNVDPWLSIAFGYIIPFILYWAQEPLKSRISPGRLNFALFYLISRCLLLIHCFGSVNQWRGLWKLMDDVTGLGPFSAFTSLVFGIVFNLVFQTFSNVLAPPLFCAVDEAATIHDCPLRYNTPPSEKMRYFWDCVFSVCVIPSLTVCCWRGLWNLLDFYLYPNDDVMSALTSLVLGYILCIILCSAQPMICDYVINLKGLVRLTIIDMTYLIGFIGCVFAWRGVWMSYDTWIIFDIVNLSDWLTVIAGSVGCTLLGCLSTVTARGVGIDGEMAEDETAEWLIPYISHLRHPVGNVPFPEPWICRFLCTSQKMNCVNVEERTKDTNIPIVNHFSKADGDVLKNSSKGTNLKKMQNASPPRIRLCQFPHMDEDSSSEEELGMERERLRPNPELESPSALMLTEVVSISIQRKH